MAEKTWQVLKNQFCHHVATQVSLEAAVVYPAEWMPEQPARVFAHRCSHGLLCNQESRPSCVWAGTNPAYDPFSHRR